MDTKVLEPYTRTSLRVPPRMIPYLRKFLIFEDDEPMESDDHRDFMNNLIQLVRDARGLPVDYYVSGNSAVYFSPEQIKNKSFRAPDFVLINHVDGSKYRDGWVVWEEGYRYPDLIIELLSPSTLKNDLGNKKQIYEQLLKTPEYFVCNPLQPFSLQGWRLQEGVYQPIEPNEKGWLWSEQLGFYLGYWEGEISHLWRYWLRFYDSRGELVLLSAEKAERKAAQAEEKVIQAENRVMQMQRQAGKQEHKTMLRAAINMQRKGIDLATITSVIDLDKAYLEKLFRRLEKLSG